MIKTQKTQCVSPNNITSTNTTDTASVDHVIKDTGSCLRRLDTADTASETNGQSDKLDEQDTTDRLMWSCDVV